MDSLRSLWQTFVALDGPSQLVKGILYLGVFVVCGRVMRLIVSRARDREAASGKDSTLSHLLYASQKPLEQAFFVLGFYCLSESLPILDKAHRIASHVLFVIGVFCLTRAAAAIGRELVDGYARSVTARHDASLDIGIFQLLKKLGVLVAWTIGLMIGLHRFEIDIMSLGAALGVGSLAIGFAARETLGNMISGFTLLLDRPFREGDRIKLATLEIGDVRDIGLRSTRIQLLDLSYLIVPNNELVNQRVVNLTYPSPKLRGAVTLTLEYGSDLAAAKETLLALARAQTEVLPEPPPSVDVLQMADSGLLVEVGFFVANQRRTGVVAELIRVAAHEKLRENSIRVAYPTRTVHHVPAPSAQSRADPKVEAPGP